MDNNNNNVSRNTVITEMFNTAFAWLVFQARVYFFSIAITRVCFSIKNNCFFFIMQGAQYYQQYTRIAKNTPEGRWMRIPTEGNVTASWTRKKILNF
jgi:hypothetical protein